MDRAIYTVSASANAAMLAQTVHSNNLANVNTAGFKAELENFTFEDVEGEGLPTRVLPAAESTLPDLSPGSLITTGRSLDFAIDGEGFMAVQAPNGEEAYTRRADLVVDESGLLTNGKGLAVLGNGGPIVLPPFQKINIGLDGTISIVPLGESPDTLAVVDRVRLVNVENNALYKDESGLLKAIGDNQPIEDGNIRLVSGVLEQSNVNPISELIRIMDLSRQFEMSMKVMKSIEENEKAVDQLSQLN